MPYLPYFTMIVPTAISAFLSSLMIIFILADSKRSRQFHQLLCLILAIADIVQSSSWWIAFKYETSTNICMLQEYLLQGSSLTKATVTVILSTVTLSIVRRGHKLSKKEFFLNCLVWMIFPCTCLPLSIYFHTAATYCRGLEDFDLVLSYSLTIILPFVCFIMINTAIFFIIRNHLITLRQQNALNPYEKTLLQLTLKLNSYPIVFSVCWSVEIVAVFVRIFFHLSSSVVNYIGIIMISLSGTGISLLYFTFEYNAIAPFLSLMKENLIYLYYSLQSTTGKKSEIGLTHYTSSAYPESNLNPLSEPLSLLPGTTQSQSPAQVGQRPKKESSMMLNEKDLESENRIYFGVLGNQKSSLMDVSYLSSSHLSGTFLPPASSPQQNQFPSVENDTDIVEA